MTRKSRGQPKVLVIDDEPDLLELLEQRAEPYNWYGEASSAEENWIWGQEHQQSGELCSTTGWCGA